MADLGEAYVNIIPKAPGIQKELKSLLGDGAAGAGEPAGKAAGSSFMAGFKTLVAGAAVGKVLKDAFSAGGDLQQSFGGLDTIYSDAAGAAKEYAQSAALAGVSANDYAETAVSIGAALKSAFSGDTTAAMESANTAIMDMTDNAAKMGTPIESIQQAYQGFAKQNYTMLDNLKLGYGGTKTEMERLLADAQKLTGVKYDIGNLGDVYDAIHVIQDNLGLTGVAALEAETTLTGSFNAMKASWTNVMAAMTTGEGLNVAIQNLSTTAGNFISVALQMFGEFASQIPAFIGGIGGAIVENSPQLIASSAEMIAQLIIGFLNGIPTFLENVPTFFAEVAASFDAVDWGSIGRAIIDGISAGVRAAASSLWEAVKSAAAGAIEWAKSVLNINSPSKVFADEVGRWIPEGMAVGIKGNLTPVRSSVDTMAATARAELRKAVSPSVNLNAYNDYGQPGYLMRPEPQQAQKIVIEFTGSLAQLGRVLQPHIQAETVRVGAHMTGGTA